MANSLNRRDPLLIVKHRNRTSKGGRGQAKKKKRLKQIGWFINKHNKTKKKKKKKKKKKTTHNKNWGGLKNKNNSHSSLTIKGPGSTGRVGTSL